MSITPPNERPRRDDLSAPSAEPLTERERRYRTLFGAMDEGFCVIEMSFDDAGRPVDYDFLEFNDAFERLTGITAEAALAGRSARELFPTLEEHWFETYGRVATTGEPARFENRAEAMGKWFEVHAFRIGGDGSREVGILFKDSTRRRLDDLERERLLAEAREREAFLHLITDRLPVRVGYLDLDYRYRFVNGAYERAFGLSPGGGVGLTVAEMAGEEAFRMAKPFLDCALAGDTHTQELTVPYAFGERSVEVQYVADRDEAGEVSGLVIHVLDVTERKRIETERERLISELEIERGKLQTLFELAPAFIAVLRGRDLVFEYVNDAYYGIVGHRPVVGLPLAEAIPEAVGGRTGQDYDRLLLDIMDTGETRTFSERPVTLQRVPDGPLEERFLDLSYQPLREADGSVSGVLVHGIDVTKGVLARREVRAAYDLLAGITESTQELIVSLDRDYCFTSLNEAYRRDFKGVFGVDPQIGQSLLDALSHLPQELANAKALWARALAGESVDLTAEFGDPGLARKVFDLRFYPIRNGVGEIVGAGEIARNVTERERLVSELAVARERLESLFMMSPSAIAVLRGEDFRFEFANAAYLMMFRRQEVAGRTVAEVFPEAEEQGFLDLLRGVMTTGTPFHHPETAFAMRATADEPARVVYVDFLYQAIREADGTVSGIFAHIVDVTSQVEARQAISQREELFRTVFEQAPDDAIVVMDADRTVTAWNPAAERITGWSASEALGQLGDLIFTAEDRRAGAPEAEAAEAMRRGKAEDERWHVRKNGSRFWGSGTMNALHDGEGGVRGYLKVFRDATERYEETQTLAFLSLLTEAVIEERDAERILETVERMLGQYLGASRVTYGEFAADEESFTVRSEWGPDVVSVLGNHTLSSYGQDAVETLRSGRNLVVRDTAKDLDPALFPQTELIQARSGVTVPVVKDGRLVALCVVHDRVPREWTDDEIGLVQQVADRMSSEIERVRAEEALRRSEERFRQLVDLSPSTVWFGEPDGGLSYISQDFYDATGLTPETALPLGWTSTVHPRDLPRVADEWAAARRDETVYDTEFRIRYRDGEYRWISARAIPLRDGGGHVTGWLGSNSDIHERKTSEERLQQRVEERTQQLRAAVSEAEGFNYSISHDLRTPLRAMVATSGILLEEAGPELSEEHRGLLVRQSENAKRLGQLIDELLRLSRLARVPVRRETLDMTVKAQAVASELEQSGGMGACRIDIQPGMVAQGDAALVRSVLQNLIGNAVKFSPAGGTVRVRQEGPVFSVSDEGVGFDMQFAPKIFNPFERLVSESEFPGTGIGLANVKRIVERHDGRVWVESAPGQGATFSFTLEPGSP